MPKARVSTKAKLTAFAKQYQKETLTLDQNTLICRCCLFSFDATNIKKFSIDQHISTAKHVRNRSLKMKRKFMTETTSEQTFTTRLCTALLAADIPLNKLTNVHFNEFLTEFTGFRVPDPSTLRKSYVQDAYENILQCIRTYIGDSPIWISIAETTDVDGRHIANVIVGKMDPEVASPAFLLDCVQLETSNNSETITKTFNDALTLLWPDGVQYEKVLLFVTEDGSYMSAAARSLQVVYTKLIHVICVVHALHCVCDTIQVLYPRINQLINNVKKIFKKSPKRLQTFKELYPNLALPPSPIGTHWGTWLTCVEYYAENILSIRNVIKILDEKEAEAIQKAKVLPGCRVADENTENESSLFDKLVADLAKVRSTYTFIADSITRLEETGVELSKSLTVLKDVVDKLTSSTTAEQKVKQKLADVLDENVGLKILSAIVTRDMKKLRSFEPFRNGPINPMILVAFKYAPIVSIDVKKSFCLYKKLLANNRRYFLLENLKMHLIITANADKVRK